MRITMRFFGLALKALVFTFLLYIVWGAVIGVGVAMIVVALPGVSVLALIGALIAIFGAAMALLSLSAVLIKISVEEATHQTTRQAERRMDAEMWRVRQSSRRASRPNSRAERPISERPGPLSEAARRRRDANRSDRN